MKKIKVLFAILFAAGLTSSRAQNTWIQKADFGGIARASIGFSIGSKGYIGTGSNQEEPYTYSDFWEYDPVITAWTQMADFGGGNRSLAVGFSIGTKGYIGTGRDLHGNFKNDFWEYDPATNAWTQKTNFGGSERITAVGFSIGSKGYIGTGEADGVKNDFWEYDPTTDSWTQKTDFGGTPRHAAVGFSIGSKGYIGTGSEGSSFQNDFWEYDPVTNAWTQKANFGGVARYQAVGFSIGTKGYIGTGAAGDYEKDFWEYDPAVNAWTQKTNFAGSERFAATSFCIGSKGYIGMGLDQDFNYKADFWEYTPDTAACTRPSNLSTGKITSSSAKLKWDTVAEAEGYKIRYKVSGTNPWTLKYSNGNSKTLNNLSSNTNYTWQIKTFCTVKPGLSSDWSAKQEFTTLTESSGADQYFTVPEGVTQLTVKLWGAGGAGGNYAPCVDIGGGGGFVTGTISVIPGETLTIVVGGKGETGAGPGAYGGGGGKESGPGGRGGGRSAIVRGGDDIITAGGGGGDGGCVTDGNSEMHGGGGGGVEGTASSFPVNGEPGTASDPGDGGHNPGTNCTCGSNPGDGHNGGYAGTYGPGYNGSGGGGYFGGGSGTDYGNGGGGGGSGLVPAGGYTEQGNTLGIGIPGGTSDPDYPGNNIGYGGVKAQNGNDGAVIIVGYWPVLKLSEITVTGTLQIYPNPAEDHATIQFTLAQTSHVSIKVFDVSGKEIETLLDGDVEQGDHSLLLNTDQFSKGIYMVKMISPAVLRDGIENQKLIVQ